MHSVPKYNDTKPPSYNTSPITLQILLVPHTAKASCPEDLVKSSITLTNPLSYNFLAANHGTESDALSPQLMASNQLTLIVLHARLSQVHVGEVCFVFIDEEVKIFENFSRHWQKSFFSFSSSLESTSSAYSVSRKSPSSIKGGLGRSISTTSLILRSHRAPASTRVNRHPDRQKQK